MTSGEDRQLTLIERAERNIDWAAVEHRRREAAARATVERIETLQRILFQDAERGSGVIDSLSNEAAAARLLLSAHNQPDDRLVLAVLRVAYDNRWHTVVETGISRCLYDRTQTLMQELWTLTTGRQAD